jgi:hypothetical protein
VQLKAVAVCGPTRRFFYPCGLFHGRFGGPGRPGRLLVWLGPSVQLYSTVGSIPIGAGQMAELFFLLGNLEYEGSTSAIIRHIKNI